jgi:hypothetical protein
VGILSLFADHPLLSATAILTLCIGVMHEVRLLLEVSLVLVRTIRRELHHWSLLLRTGSGDGETLVVDTANVESVRRLVRVLKRHETVEASATDK